MAYRDTILAESTLVNYYELSADGADSKGTGTGTVTGGVTFGAGGVAGNCATFNGSTGYVTIPRPVQDDFTIEFWLRTTGSAPSGSAYYQGWGLVNAEVGGVTNDFGTSLVAGGRVCGGTGNPDTMLLTPQTSWNDGAWHHVALTRIKSTGSIALYLDGQKWATGTGGTTSLTAPATVTVGRLLPGGGFFSGSLDELAFYSAALTQQQVQSHYVAGGGSLAQPKPFRAPPARGVTRPSRGTLKLLAGGPSLANLASGKGAVPYAATGGGAGALAPGSSPWGQCPAFSNAGHTVALQYPGAAVSTAYPRVTLAVVFRANGLPASGSTLWIPVGTNAGGAGVELALAGDGTVQLRYESVGITTTGLAWYAGDWTAAAVTHQAGTTARSAWVYSYDRGTYASASFTSSSSPAAGTGGPQVNDQTGTNSTYFDGTIACALVDESAWTENDFRRFAADPFHAARPPARLSAPLSVAVAAPPAYPALLFFA